MYEMFVGCPPFLLEWSSDDMQKDRAREKLFEISRWSKEVIEEEMKVLIGTYARARVILSNDKGYKLYDPQRPEFLDM